VEKVGIGLVGYGTVGSGVGRLLHESADEIRLATGKDVSLRTVCELSAERRALVPPGCARRPTSATFCTIPRSAW